MTSSTTTEGYVKIPRVIQTAGLELMVDCYEQMTLAPHSDRNVERDATETSQKFVGTNGTLKDESEQRKHGLLYPSQRHKDRSSQYRQEASPTPVPTSQSKTLSENPLVAELQKSKQKRVAQWHQKCMTLESSISKIKRVIRQLKLESNDIVITLAHEAAVKAQREVEESSEEKALRRRKRQQQKIERDRKKRKIDAEKSKLEAIYALLRKSIHERRDADIRDQCMIESILLREEMEEQWHRKEQEIEKRRVNREQWENK